MTIQLPMLSDVSNPGQDPETPAHKFSIERIPSKDMLIVQRDRGPRIEIPMKALAQGKTIAEAYEELSDA